MENTTNGKQKLVMQDLTSLRLRAGEDEYLAATATDDEFESWVSNLPGVQINGKPGWAPEQRVDFMNFLLMHDRLDNVSRVGDA